MSHELLKFHENIAHQAIPSCKEPCVKDISRVIGSSSLPLLQTLISNQVLVAKQIRLQLRTKAASSVRTHSVRVSLIDGSLFSAGLFDQAAIAKAEDCLKHTPQTVVVQQPSFHSSDNHRQHTPTYNREGPARSSFHRYKGKGSQYQRHSAPVYIPTRHGKAARTKVSLTREKVASKTSAHNNKALQAPPRNNDSHLPLRLRRASHLWSFASRMTKCIITKDLTWRWSVKPPKLSLPSHSTCRGDLAPTSKTCFKKGSSSKSRFSLASPVLCSLFHNPPTDRGLLSISPP